MIKAKIKILVKTETGTEKKEIDGYVSDDFPGLAVHRDHAVPDYWVITHLESGYQVNLLSFTRRKDAVMVARWVSQRFDFRKLMESQERSDEARGIMRDAFYNQFAYLWQ